MLPPTKPEFFQEIKEWSERKLDLLKKYLDGATRILGSINRVYYVDGFAGWGSYGKPGAIQIPGSPLQAAEYAWQLEQAGKSYSLRCINIESNPQTFQGLQSETAPYSRVVTNLPGTFVDNVDTILKLVGQNPMICFLDPFGVDGMDWTAVQKLIRRPGKTDFWIRFDVDEVRRRDGYYDDSRPGADKQFEILTRVYGIPDKDALHTALQAPTSEDRKLKAVRLYQRILGEEFRIVKGEGHAEAYRIGSLQAETKYFLVFGTADKKGLILARNIVYGIEETYQREVERHKLGDQSSFLPFIDPTEEEIMAAKVAQVKEEIWNKCKGQKVTRRDVHARVLANGTWFGVIKGPHITRALKALSSEGRIIDRTGAGWSDDNASFTFRS